MRYCIYICAILILAGCTKSENPGFSGQGKKPVYLPESELLNITNLAEQPVENSGPIFLLDTLFFMTEMNKGIHIYNVKDSINIGYETFLSIPAISDFTVSSDLLYANNWTNLVTIDISDIYNAEIVSVIDDAFEPLLSPPLYQGIFECVDLDLGAVVDWDETTLNNVFCRTLN